jgi:hypothetical protein
MATQATQAAPWAPQFCAEGSWQTPLASQHPAQLASLHDEPLQALRTTLAQTAINRTIRFMALTSRRGS